MENVFYGADSREVSFFQMHPTLVCEEPDELSTAAGLSWRY